MAERIVGQVGVREHGDPAEPGVLLWPGLGFSGAYFRLVSPLLPWRTVAVDPPGWGGSPALDGCTHDLVIDLAAALLETYRCIAVVGHSIGGSVALGVANRAPAQLRAVVLVDGGYLDDAALAELGSLIPKGAGEALRWAVENEPRYRDWDVARAEVAADCRLGTDIGELDPILRDVLEEVDGEVRASARPEAVAALVTALRDADVTTLARGVAVPTLLLACAQPPERRGPKERAWRSFATASPLIELHVADNWCHHPFLEAPRASAAVVESWLQPHIVA